MLKKTLALALLGGLAGCAGNNLVVADVGSFHVGGRTVTLSGLPEKEIVYSPGAPVVKVNPNGDYAVEALYARYTLLASPKARYPLMLWHGGGLAGTTFETKPDGKPGWESYFLRAGYNVYVNDAVERGRASWARYPEIFKGEPFFRPKKEAWELFRIGETGGYASNPSARKSIAGTQFPIEYFDQFAKQAIPRWSTNDAATQAAYDAYVEKVCPCVIVVHSQGGNFAFNSALKYPDKVKALVAVETSGSPDPDTFDYAKVKSVPMLWLWGDNLDKAPWPAVFARQEKFRTLLVKAGGIGDRIALPELGVRGNTHMLMMDRNSDQVAELIDRWLTRQGVKR
ncbi:alpha/beta fold hydrolase [uncultured Variovorax sp.]|uniref:alpha/beta fold hydrolase n=1 Tax=uncultured Variovorax sp. TaxID=114708 RepID=UPI002600846E|nr:alpha/beta fold hydrolase [uncultured Variovorax sp.]